MKPAIYYALTKYRHEIVAVTSESRYSRVNGRYVKNDQPSHWTTYDLIGKFETSDAAQAKVNRLQQIHNKHRPLIETAIKALRDAERAEEMEIEAELKNAAET